MAIVGVASVVLQLKDNEKFQQGLKAAKTIFSAVGKFLINMAKKIAQGISFAINKLIEFGRECVKVAGQFEKLQTTLNSRVGADVGNDLMKKLKKMSSTYGLPLDQLISATHTLLDFGYSAEQIPSLLKLIGSAALQAGGDVNTATQTIATMLGRMQMGFAPTKKQLDTLQRNGVDVMGELARQLGVSIGQVAQKISSLSPEQVRQAVMASLQATSDAIGNYANTYESQQNRFQTAMLEMKETIGKLLLPYLIKASKYFTAIVQTVTDYLQQHGSEIAAWINSIVQQITPILFRIGAVLTGVINIIKNMAPALDAVIDAFRIVYNICLSIMAIGFNIGFVYYKIFEGIALFLEKGFSDLQAWKDYLKSIPDEFVEFNNDAIVDKFIPKNASLQEAIAAGDSWGGAWLQGAMNQFGNFNQMIQNRMAQNEAEINATPAPEDNLPVASIARQDTSATLRIYDDLYKKIQETKDRYMGNLAKLGSNAWAMSLTGGLGAEMMNTYNALLSNQDDRQISLLEQIANNTSGIDTMNDFNSINSSPLEGY